MNLFRSGQFGWIVEDTVLQIARTRDLTRGAIVRGRDACMNGHLILERYGVDEHGHISLTPSIPARDLGAVVATMSASLESLFMQLNRRYPGVASPMPVCASRLPIS